MRYLGEARERETVAPEGAGRDLLVGRRPPSIDPLRRLYRAHTCVCVCEGGRSSSAPPFFSVHSPLVLGSARKIRRGGGGGLTAITKNRHRKHVLEVGGRSFDVTAPGVR